MTASIEARDFTVEFFFHSKGRTLCPCYRIHKPETGVVARVFIFRTGITQSYNQINTC